ncbi:hypothetical protein [Actinoplanes utahensis]|uniref:hypothetical protein n=1 Tax=Actinoplanes utahensis TaxID=1869 RepID=UPI0007C6EB62|nr:hypothetical protein [Actinoplanes utahensis]GIF31152.1 hypothetical protein Aut01nite_41380 [Actinoplanes utahensis]
MYSEQWPPYSPQPSPSQPSPSQQHGRADYAPGYAQPGYPQPEYPRPGYPQPEYPRPEYPRPEQNRTEFLYQQPGYPPDPYGYGHPRQDDAAAITITARYFPLAFLLALVKPVVTVDGRPVAMRWREPAVVPVAPGQHHLHAHTPYLLPRRMGKADLVVTAHPGQSVDVEYKAPLVVFAGGALGAPPQRYPGTAAFVALMAVTMVLGLFGIVSTALGTGGITGLRPAAGQTASPSPVVSDIPALPPLSTDGPGLPTDVPDARIPGQGAPGRTAGQTPPAESAGRPRLRDDAPARRISGPGFAASDRTRTMGFAGWPFAFRVPSGWDCDRQSEKRPDARVYVCAADGGTDRSEAALVVLRPCPSACGTAQMDALNAEFFRPTDKPRRNGGDATFVVEEAKGRSGGYELAVTHFFSSTTSAGTENWQVGVAGFAPPNARKNSQRIVNDVVSQTT